MQSGRRSNDQERSPNVVVFSKVSHNRNGLDCLSETHFVGKNSVDTLLIQIDQPVQTLQLVFLQLGSEHGWLRNLNVTQTRGVLEVQFAFVKGCHLILFRVKCAGPVLGLLNGTLCVGHGSLLQSRLVFGVEIQLVEIGDFGTRIGDTRRQVNRVFLALARLDGLIRPFNSSISASIGFCTLDLTTNKVRVEFGLGDEEVQLALLAVGLALSLSLLGRLYLLLFSQTAQIALFALVSFPEGRHLTHRPLGAGLGVLGALVGAFLPLARLLTSQLSCLPQVFLTSAQRKGLDTINLGNILPSNIPPNLFVDLIVAFAVVGERHGRGLLSIFLEQLLSCIFPGSNGHGLVIFHGSISGLCCILLGLLLLLGLLGPGRGTPAARLAS